MKKIGSVIQTVLTRTCVCFTVTVLVLWGAASAVAAASHITNWSFGSETFGAILLFSALVALFSLVLGIGFIASKALRVCLHFVLTLAAFLLFLITLGTVQASGIFILCAVFALLYGIVAAVCLVFSSRKQTQKKEKETYRPQFGKSESNS